MSEKELTFDDMKAGIQALIKADADRKFQNKLARIACLVGGAAMLLIALL